MSISDKNLLLRLDAIGCHVTLVYGDGGDTVLARIPGADILRPKGFTNSLAGAGEDAAEALTELWNKISDLDREEYLRVQHAGQSRYWRWNGQAWKERPPQQGATHP